jgi:hypothetical protein
MFLPILKKNLSVLFRCLSRVYGKWDRRSSTDSGSSICDVNQPRGKMYSDVNTGEHHGSRVKSTRNFRGMGGGKRQRAAILKPCDEGSGGWAPPCLTRVLLFLDSCILFYPEIVFGPNLVFGHPSLPMWESR